MECDLLSATSPRGGLEWAHCVVSVGQTPSGRYTWLRLLNSGHVGMTMKSVTVL